MGILKIFWTQQDIKVVLKMTHHQPREGPRWKAQDKDAECLRDASTNEKNA